MNTMKLKILKMELLNFSLMSDQEEYSIFSEKFKREVDIAHQLFFEKRGMSLKSLDGDFLFGSAQFRKFREDNPLWSLHESDQPISQFSPEMNHNHQP